MRNLFDPPPTISVPIAAGDLAFPVRRVYCVGRNYAAHVVEMGGDPERGEPFFFAKPRDAVVARPATIPYPSATSNLHHEVELVVALDGAGEDLTPKEAALLVFGCAVGVDLTRRDRQAEAKKNGRPWTTAKGFDYSAPVSAIVPMTSRQFRTDAAIRLAVNGTTRQESRLDRMIWSVPELLARLSAQFRLQPGDLVFTGTPEGVGPLRRHDRVEASIDGVGELSFAVR